MRKRKYLYYAVFYKEGNGYHVAFPDFWDSEMNCCDCFTCGDNMSHSLEMAMERLAIELIDYEDEGKEIPLPSEPENLKIEMYEEAESYLIIPVEVDTVAYRKRFDPKRVKKTLTIPSWLNDLAISKKVNFSQILEEALENKLT